MGQRMRRSADMKEGMKEGMKAVLRRFCTGLLCVLLLLPALTGCGKKRPCDIINDKDSFRLELTHLADIPAVGTFSIMQGGCMTEDSYYFALINSENSQKYTKTEAYVFKYDKETMTEVERSEVMMLGHANDFTYIEETNEIWVIHVCFGQISVLDADTLELKEIKLMNLDGYGLDYEETKEQFVVIDGINFPGRMTVWDKELEPVAKQKKGLDTTLVSQGICCDEKYVYQTFWSSSRNEKEPDSMLFVTDWEGNLITKIKIDLDNHEPENVSILGDTFYLGFNMAGDADCAVFSGKLVRE